MCPRVHQLLAVFRQVRQVHQHQPILIEITQVESGYVPSRLGWQMPVVALEGKACLRNRCINDGTFHAFRTSVPAIMFKRKKGYLLSQVCQEPEKPYHEEAHYYCYQKSAPMHEARVIRLPLVRLRLANIDDAH